MKSDEDYVYEVKEEELEEENGITIEELDEYYAVLIGLPKTIMSTQMHSNIIFKLGIRFLSNKYVEIKYESYRYKLMYAKLNINENFYNEIYEMLEWMEMNKFKVLKPFDTSIITDSKININ